MADFQEELNDLLTAEPEEVPSRHGFAKFNTVEELMEVTPPPMDSESVEELPQIDLTKTITQVRSRSKPKKKQIMDDIDQLRDHLGYVYVKAPDGEWVRDATAPVQGKKPELQRILAMMLEDCIQLTNGIQPEERLYVPEGLEEHIKRREEYAAETLYRMNVTMAIMAERTAEHFEDKTGIHLEGYSEGLKESKEELIKVMRQIYKENEEVMSQYMSPTTALLMINAQAAMKGLKKVS